MKAFGKKYHLWMLAESFSVLSSFSIGVSDVVFKEGINQEKEYFIFKKHWNRKGCVITRKRPDTNYCQVLGRTKFVRFSHAPKIHLREAENLKKAIGK